MAAARSTNDLQELRAAAGIMAEKEILEGRPEEAVALMAPLVEGGAEEDWEVTMILPVYAWAQLECGHVERGSEIIVAALRRIGERNRVVLVEALRVHGIALAAQGRYGEAEDAFRRTVELARSMPWPYAEARALYRLGVLLLDMGSPREARSHLDAAVATFRRLGAHPFVERAEQKSKTARGVG
jgi:tetratricopeptide (TPR) repeat protein